MASEALAYAGQETVLETGERVVYESLDTLQIDESIGEKSVEMHEAWHTLAAILLKVPVKHVTVIPEGAALGATYLKGYNALVFAAAHAKGCDGTGHDLHVIQMMDGGARGAVSQARELLSGARNLRRAKAIATLLRRRKAVSGDEAWAVFHEAHKQEKEGSLFLVRVIAPDGKTVTKEMRAKKGQRNDFSRELALVRVEKREEKPKADDGADIIVSGKLPIAANEN